MFMKTGENVKIRQIFEQFWKGVKPLKSLFFLAYIGFFLSQIANLFAPIYYKRFFDIISNASDRALTASGLVKVIFIILIFHFLNWLFWRIGMYFYNIMQPRVMARLKQISFDYLSKHSYTFFANNFSGGLVQKVNRFSRAFEAITDNLAFSIMPLIITVIGSITIMWFVAPPVVSIIMMIWVFLFAIFSLAFSRWKMKYDLASAEADSKTSGYLADAITNSNTISYFTGHTYESANFKEVSNDQAKKQRTSWLLGEVVDATTAIFIVLVEFFVFYFAIKYWQQNLITIGTFVLAQTYIIGLAQRLWSLNSTIRHIYQGIADSKEMVEILAKPHEIKDIPNAKPLLVSEGRIDFTDVSFNFNETREIIKNFNSTIKSGEKVALIGPSGAGKTTLVRLIMRLYDVTKGAVMIDGQNIQQVAQESLRSQISFVPQEPVLFHRTLMENIRYGRRNATDEEVIEAARMAHCGEFIESLPSKYETLVGERGIKLSGGERQRVAIARAILKKAPVLILDEATSSLDSNSESLIQDALNNLMKECTTIVIAHRLSTIKKMDRIVVLEEGQVAEEGTHEELSKKEGGLYQKLWNLQVSGFIKDEGGQIEDLATI